jgi:hypothetical protein
LPRDGVGDAGGLLDAGHVLVVRGVQEGAAAARGELLHRLARGGADFLMAAVVVQVAGEEDPQLHAARREHLLAQVQQVGLVELAAQLPILVRVDPGRLREAHDGPVARLHVRRGDVPEVLDLRRVDVRLQLPVRAQQPPAVGQPQREVAARLPRGPAREPSSADIGHEEAGERAQPVVPVVIAGDGEDVRRLFRKVVAERRVVGHHQPAIVRFATRRGIDLVTTEDEQVAPR